MRKCAVLSYLGAILVMQACYITDSLDGPEPDTSQDTGASLRFDAAKDLAANLDDADMSRDMARDMELPDLSLVLPDMPRDMPRDMPSDIPLDMPVDMSRDMPSDLSDLSDLSMDQGMDSGVDQSFDQGMDQGFDQDLDLDAGQGSDQSPDLPSSCDATAQFQAGSGTSQDPYVICAPEHFDHIRQFSDSSFVLSQDIHLGGVSWVPIPLFSGVLEGAGFTVHDLSVTGGDDVGGFAQELHGRLAHISFEGLAVLGNGTRVGGIASLASGAVVEDVSVEGVVTGLDYVGMFAGRVNARVDAGLGLNVPGEYDRISLLGTVEVFGAETSPRRGHTGMFAGWLTGGAVLNQVHVQGEVKGLASPTGPWKIGGLVGGAVASSFNECSAQVFFNVPFGTRLGGLVGVAQDVSVLNSWASIDGAGRAVSGGIFAESVGSKPLTLSYVWAANAISVTNSSFPARGILGMGVVLTGNDMFYDSDLTVDGGVMSSQGFSAAELQDPLTYTGWPSPPWLFLPGKFPELQ